MPGTAPRGASRRVPLQGRNDSRYGTIPAEELVRDCADRRPGAWDEFIRRYADLVYSTILKVDLDEEDRKDAFQGTFLAIQSSLERLRNPESLVSWIARISYLQAMDRIRRRARAREVPLGDGDGSGGAFDPQDPSGLPDRLRLELESAQQIREALEGIPARCRRLLELLFFREPAPDYADISRAEGIPIGSIGPTRARCIEKLRRIYEERGWVE